MRGKACCGWGCGARPCQVTCPTRIGVGIAVGVAVADRVGVAAAVRVLVGDGVRVAVAVPVAVGVRLGVAVGVLTVSVTTRVRSAGL
jgi:hypothetical protein